MNTRSLKSSVTCVVGVLALAGCGSSSSSSSAPPATTGTPAATTPVATTPAAGGSSKVTLQADPAGTLKFQQTSLTASAGTVTVAFENASSTPHNVTFTDSTGKALGSTPTFSAGSKTVTLKLAKGTYTYFCSVPGHEQAGMKGTLSVN